jgi:TIR domain/Domain of unknown function (DUF4062)
MLRHDVFISYAHIDNEPDLPNQQGWVSIFQGALRTRLSKALGREVDVWWDQRELRGDRVFDQTIREACEASTLMVAVVSPRYVQSESCRKELAYFTSGDETNVRDVSRLLTIGKTPVAAPELGALAQPALADVVNRTLGYRFYHTDEGTKRVRELHIYDSELIPSFQRKLEELAQDLAAQLRAHSGSVTDSANRRAPRASGIEALSSPDLVFLAATTSDVAPLRDAIQLELTDKKIPICASTTWSDEHQAVVAELERAVAGASIAVHILGAAYGSRPDGSDRSVPELQFDHVAALARARPRDQPLIRLAWLPTLAAPVRAAQQAFISKLRAYDDWGEADDLLTGTREQLAARISAKLELLREQRLKREREASKQGARPAADAGRSHAAGSLPRRIYVISEQHDHEAARRIERALALPDWEVLSASEISNDAETEQERERQHQEYLEQSEAFLIYHGDAKFRWVRAQADEVRKALGRRGQGDLLGSVYVAKPLSGPRASYQLVGLRRVDELHDEPRQNLRPFLDLLAAAVAAE